MTRTETSPDRGAREPEHADIFGRVICAVDPSSAGIEAARQIDLLAPTQSTLRLVTAFNARRAATAHLMPESLAVEREHDAHLALQRACDVLRGSRAVETAVLDGNPLTVLQDQITELAATLIAVGSHGGGRAASAVADSVATHLAHRARCSLLVARPSPRGDTPRPSIVVGTDGSDASRRAEAAARALASRLRADLRFVHAARSGSASQRVRNQAPDAELVPGRAVPVLVEASEHADLLIVGSRGRSGLRALGSVSERTMHRAPCSVIIVR